MENKIIQQLKSKDYHEGRITCRKRYEKSGLLVCNPDVDWEKELTDPCKTCNKRNDGYMIPCLEITGCEKKQRQLLAIEIDEHFDHIS